MSPSSETKQNADARPLSAMSPGALVSVTVLEGGRSFMAQMAGMGITAGADLRVLRHGEGGRGPIIVAVGESRFALGRGMAERVFVVERKPATDGFITLTLFDLVGGERARIVRIRGRGARSIRQRLLDMGVTRGTELYVERHAPLGDPVEVKIKGYSLALRMSEAMDIEVERLQ